MVEAVGDDVTDFSDGDRVGYFTGPPGAYATHREIDAAKLVKLPDSIDAETAAATMLKGCTVEYLVERCARIQAGRMGAGPRRRRRRRIDPRALAEGARRASHRP